MKFERARGLRVTGKLDETTASALGLRKRCRLLARRRRPTSSSSGPLRSGPRWYGDTWKASRGSGRVDLGVDIGARPERP